MDLPIFFSAELDEQSSSIFLDETASRHAIQVLRMKEGSQLQLANGKGMIATAVLSNSNKRGAGVDIQNIAITKTPPGKVSVAISLVKNAVRFEWFLEKATEIGISEVVPLICQRTERQAFKQQRLHNILVSALLQSQQAWMPALSEPIAFGQFLEECETPVKFIAHCEEELKQPLASELAGSSADKIILIGPEGDFTQEEIQSAIGKGFLPVSLGDTRLRTETAGIVAAVLMKQVQ